MENTVDAVAVPMNRTQQSWGEAVAALVASQLRSGHGDGLDASCHDPPAIGWREAHLSCVPVEQCHRVLPVLQPNGVMVLERARSPAGPQANASSPC